MIIVGSRRGGLRVSMHEFFGGSVAAHLAHRQSRPVVVIPLSPVPAGGRLPWEGGGAAMDPAHPRLRADPDVEAAQAAKPRPVNLSWARCALATCYAWRRSVGRCCSRRRSWR